MAGRLASGPVALGYAEGDIVPAHDVDPFASKLGGRPVWLDAVSPVPPHAATACQQCGSAMLLLVQAYVPLRDSPYDRVLYVWACNRRACSGAPGAAKATRAHILNEEYAQTLARRAEEASHARPSRAKQIGLPGSLFAGVVGPEEPLDFGSVWRANAAASSGLPEGPAHSAQLFSGPLFGKGLAEPVASPAADTDPGAAAADLEDETGLAGGIERLAIASEPAAATGEADASHTSWGPDAPAVPAMYLAFEDEEEPRAHARVETQCRAEIQEAMEAACAVHEHGGGRHGKSKQVAADDCAEERYERDALPPGTDAAFARFSRVVSRNPEQVLRYQFGGVPLLYTAQDETARLLRAGPQSGDSGSDSDSDSDAGGGGWRRGCSTDGLPKCPRCGARRVFECQIMPALLSVLQLSSHAQQTAGREADLRAAAAQGLAGGRLLQSFDLGMEFGAALVFVCEADCHREQPSGRPGATYYDELVLVQQESL